MKKIRWGIAGPGIIANKFAEAISLAEGVEIVAVASKTKGKGEEFAKKYNIPRVYASYEDMAKDPEIDVVYVSTAHPFHCGTALVFINEGKHILCEKPMCVDSQSAKILSKAAKEKGVFLMEAMWTAFLPAILALEKDINRGIVGQIQSLKADFCYYIEPEEDPKLFVKELNGGSLLDVGVYCLYFANMILGEPESIEAESDIQNGVDYYTKMTLNYKSGEKAELSSAIRLEKPFDAYIYGEKGRIYVPDFYKADRYFINYTDGTKEEKVFEYGNNGFEFEINEVCRCIDREMTESQRMPVSLTIKVLEQMDGIRGITGMDFE